MFHLFVINWPDSTEKGDADSGGDGDTGRKSKRARTRTQPFQSSDMDVNLLRVIKASAAAQATAAAQLAKANEEKLVVFFKGEFLAVRNAEGGFYICQVNHKTNLNKLYTEVAVFYYRQRKTFAEAAIKFEFAGYPRKIPKIPRRKRKMPSQLKQ